LIVNRSKEADIEIRGRFHHHVYQQLLRAQIPKAQKRQSSRQYLFALLGSACKKALCKILVKLSPDSEIGL